MQFSWLFFAGAIPVFFSFFIVTLLCHYNNWDPVMVGVRRIFAFICRKHRIQRYVLSHKDFFKFVCIHSFLHSCLHAPTCLCTCMGRDPGSMSNVFPKLHLSFWVFHWLASWVAWIRLTRLASSEPQGPCYLPNWDCNVSVLPWYLIWVRGDWIYISLCLWDKHFASQALSQPLVCFWDSFTM